MKKLEYIVKTTSILGGGLSFNGEFYREISKLELVNKINELIEIIDDKNYEKYI